MRRNFDDIDAVLEYARNRINTTAYAVKDEDWQACAEIHTELAELFSTLERIRVVRMNNVYPDHS